ncbi:TIGR03757 family integrating conjugative element protein [Xanthomonas oryzae pv. oryzicola]|uniref:TIGR03757 family integrating conjugative element protein n=1 Tax=Xanthomonas oryzae TaxID=347 RepID=UPI0010341ECE|nr:TIGR03757 family integrating conjugative element protein [Xanthomonas oryzae]QBG94462.1 TIGR03757 family integrating conjugative element protein [Xanthomonas oryzae]QBH01394.1 TIGR03757 family integrating conjugative element protein [Xanthomonas oryzae]
MPVRFLSLQPSRLDCGAQTSAMLALLFLTSTAGAEVRVFTDSAHPVAAPADVVVTEMDAPARLAAILGKDLPSDPIQAEGIMRQRLANDAEQARIAQAYQGVADAYSAGIAKLPAVLVDGRYVVYGESQVSNALTRIATYRKAQP